MWAFFLIACEINMEWLFISDGEGKGSRSFILRNIILLSDWCFYVVMYPNLVNTISPWISEDINYNLFEAVSCFLEDFPFTVRHCRTCKSMAGTARFLECAFTMQATFLNRGPPGKSTAIRASFVLSLKYPVMPSNG